MNKCSIEKFCLANVLTCLKKNLILPTSITLSAFSDAATKTPSPQAPLAAAPAPVVAAAHTDASDAPACNNMMGVLPLY